MLGADSSARVLRVVPGPTLEAGPAPWEAWAVGLLGASPGLVGRAGELDRLGAALDAAAGGRAGTVLVGGDAGIGKSRLVEEFCGRVLARGATAATGACVPAEGGLPYGPVVGILRALVRQLGAPTAEEVLQRLVAGPGLAQDGRGEHYTASARLVDQLAKTRLFDSVLTCLTELAGQAPIVLVFEDVQWADSASAELLDFLTRNLGEARVLLVATYRSEEFDRGHPLRPWLNELVRHPRVTQLHLDGLDRGELAEVIARIIGEQPDWALTEAVWARSQGNPFFAEELTAARHSPSLPSELQGVIMSRVERLSAGAQQLLRVVACVGPAADHGLLVALGVLDADALDAALAETVDRQILVVEQSMPAYQFRHALLQEAVHAALLPVERRRLHREIAAALTADRTLSASAPAHRVAELAAQWWAAGEWAEALAPSVAAADAAVGLLAFPEALVHLEHALSALDRLPPGAVPPGTRRVALLERAADVAYMAGDNARSVELARAAVDAVDPAVDPRTAARCYTLLGRNAWGLSDSAAAFDAYGKAVALLPADPPSAELARVLAEDARGLMLMSRYRDSVPRCLEAIAVAQAAGARSEEGHALNTLGCSRSMLGNQEEGIALVREALAIATELDNPDDLNRGYTNLVSMLFESAHIEESAAVVLDAIARGGDPAGVTLSGATANGIEALVCLGRYDEAEDLLARMGTATVGVCASSPVRLPAPMAIRRGRFPEAARLLSVMDERTVVLKDVPQRGAFHALRSELALEEGRPEDASEDVDQGLALAVGTDDITIRPELVALGVRALADRLDAAHAHGGRFDAVKARLLAAQLVDELQDLLDSRGTEGGRCPPRSLAFACLSAAEQSRLDRSDPERWAQAASRWEELKEPYPTAYCRWREAEALLEGRAGRGRARECLGNAWHAARELGTLPLVGRIERLAQRARIPLREPDAADVGDRSSLGSDLGLTPREAEVLGQLAAGRTDREIAESLFISKKTASVHVSSLLRKLDVANRVEAGKVGQAHGLG
jgi:DNA-binding CsgD family transcriptional regulator